MADWIQPIDTETDPDRPLTSGLAKRWDNNVIAAFEGADGSPYMSASWHPFDGVYDNDGNGGILYDFAVDGVQLTVESPLLSAEFEYRIIWQGLSFDNSVDTNNSLVLEGRGRVSGVYDFSLILSGTGGPDPFSGIRNTATTPTMFDQIKGLSEHTQYRFKNNVTGVTGNSFDSGKLILIKRRRYQFG